LKIVVAKHLGGSYTKENAETRAYATESRSLFRHRFLSPALPCDRPQFNHFVAGIWQS